MSRIRLDQLVVQQGLAESREKAQRLILAGQVAIGTEPATKPGKLVDDASELHVAAREPFVGRGGLKLRQAFDVFHLDVAGLICLDVGASTGGFTDCLLQRGAAKVYAVDVGKGQLHWKLRTDPRVVVMESVNARHLRPEDVPEPVGFACMDVSFISLTKVLPAVTRLVQEGRRIVTLIKPQFEAERRQVGKGGVVRDPAVHEAVVAKIRRFGTEEAGLRWIGVCESPVKGPAGNIEFLACWEKP